MNNFILESQLRISAGLVWTDERGNFSTGDFSFHSDTYVDGELLLWLDATDINGDGNLSNEPFGGTVDQWRDKSGHSRHA